MTYNITLGDECNYYKHDSYVINASVLQLIQTISSDIRHWALSLLEFKINFERGHKHIFPIFPNLPFTTICHTQWYINYAVQASIKDQSENKIPIHVIFIGTLNLPKYGNSCTVTKHIPAPADMDVVQAAVSSPRQSSVQQLGFSLHRPKL